jgi:hypothetical protein
VDDQDRGQFGGIRRPHEVALDASVALRRRHRVILRLDAFVVCRNLHGPCIVRLEHLEECCRGHTADGKFLGAIQKLAAADTAMHVSVEQV